MIMFVTFHKITTVWELYAYGILGVVSGGLVIWMIYDVLTNRKFR